MSVKIKLKHSSVANKAPQPSDLDNGELALNTNAASPAAYIKDSNGNIVKLAGAGAIGDDWTRTGTVLSPATAGDQVHTATGRLTVGGTAAAPKINFRADGSAELAANTTYGPSPAIGGRLHYLTLGPGPFGVGTDTDYCLAYYDSNNKLKYGFETDGRAQFASDVKIGGTLPASPNISLKADGSATFAGNVGITDGTSAGIILNKAGVMTMQRATSGTSGGQWVILQDVIINTVSQSALLGVKAFDGSTRYAIDAVGNHFIGTSLETASPKISLKADGSATFAGKVGIGTATPAALINTSAASAPNTTHLLLSETGTTGDSETLIRANNSTQNWDRGAIGFLRESTSNNFALRFLTAFAGVNSEKARLDSSGRLLVGTSTSTQIGGREGNLQVSGVNSSMTLLQTQPNNTGAFFSFGAKGNGVGGAVVNNSALGRIEFGGYDGTDYQSLGAQILAQVDGTPGADDMPGRLGFFTTPAGKSAPTERMRIASTGAIGLSGANYGTSGQVLTSSGPGSAPTWKTAGSGSGALTMDKYVIFHDDGSIIASAGISSITKTDVSRYTINFSGNMNNENYLILGTGRNYIGATDQRDRTVNIYNTSASSCDIAIVSNNNQHPGGGGGHVAFYNT